MNAQPTPLPTLREELDRKTVEQLHQLVTSLMNGQINADAYSSGGQNAVGRLGRFGQ